MLRSQKQAHILRIELRAMTEEAPRLVPTLRVTIRSEKMASRLVEGGDRRWAVSEWW
jgi:hypothetical protein